MLALVASVALTARQPAPPTVAEFAPQALEQIDEPPPEQAEAPGVSEDTSGPAAAPDEPEPSPTPTSELDEVEDAPRVLTEEEQARVRRCVGERQTEDPQSPPCMNFFDGDDNGGVTWPGVTRDEIVVAMAEAGFGESQETMQGLVDHFNDRYEFYGRKIRLVGYAPTGGAFAQPDPASMVADAVKVHEEIGAFASLGYVDRKGSEHHYYDELARRGVISSFGRLTNLGTEARLARFAPFQWNVMPPIETAMSLTGSMICQTLAGRSPDGGGPQTASAPSRVFGLIVNTAADGSAPPFDVLQGTLSSCGVELAAFHEDMMNAPDTTGAVLKMQNAGVTSVICLCSVDTAREGYTQAATQQLYFPEWVMGSYLNMDLDNSYHGTLPEQQENVLGLSLNSPLRPRQITPWWRANKEQRPDSDPEGGNYYVYWSRYQHLLLLASGIQMAGPDLTPESFQAGLHAARFPNPGHGQPPLNQARVGFEGGRHTMTDSATLFWYSANEGGTVDPAVPGAVCYVNGGTRFRIGGFPTQDQPFFDGPCR